METSVFGRFQFSTEKAYRVRLSTPRRAHSVVISRTDAMPSRWPRMRRMVAATRPHLLVTLANDAWFGDSQEPWLHLSLARLRAIEHRRFLVRSTNSGVRPA